VIEVWVSEIKNNVKIYQNRDLILKAKN